MIEENSREMIYLRYKININNCVLGLCDVLFVYGMLDCEHYR